MADRVDVWGDAVSLLVGQLDGLARQPADAYALNDALLEWRCVLSRRTPNLARFRDYTTLYCRHAAILREYGAALAPEVTAMIEAFWGAS